jgi:hypothetical protein
LLPGIAREYNQCNNNSCVTNVIILIIATYIDFWNKRATINDEVEKPKRLFLSVKFGGVMGAKITNKDIERSRMLHFKANTFEFTAINLLSGVLGVNLSEALRICVRETAQRHGLDGALVITQLMTTESKGNHDLR